MDKRKLTTMDLLELSILNTPRAKTDIPEDRQKFQYRVFPWNEDEEQVTPEELTKKLNNGNVIRCSEEYGIPFIWIADGGTFHGQLLQYREVTESHVFATAEEAISWFLDTAEGCAG